MKIASILGVAGFAAAGASAQLIGPFDIMQNATSAQLIAGGGAGWDWINTVNADTSVNDAFSGSDLIDRGYANASLGTIVEVTFARGITNQPGDDAVLFDARFSDNSYSVSADHDGFSTALVFASSDFTNTGVNRRYFYGGSGPFEATVFGVAFDLSNLGVAPGQKVLALRFETTSGQADPLGFGSLVPTPGGTAVLATGLLLGARRRR